MSTKIPFAKDLREKYPYAVAGHKKKCTCFLCGLKRDEMWAKDNPYQAEIVAEQQKQKREQIIAIGNAIKSDPKVAKANQNYAIIGNKYYKERTPLGMDSIHCSKCLQRLGGMSYPCPFGHGYDFVYGKMINNPADKRWDEPQFKKKTSDVSFAEQQLKERMKDGGSVENLK